MGEVYPDDSVLVGLTEDSATGVQYIPTGLNPYYVEFRRLVQRMLLACGRANDFRPYQDGNLSFGVRAGRCLIHGTAVTFAGATGVEVAGESQTWAWLDAEGQLATGVTGLPTDRTGMLPIARIVSGTSSISEIEDLRGEAFLHVPWVGSIGIPASAERIHELFEGLGETATAAALNRLTGGPASTADQDHRHLWMTQDLDGEALFKFKNDDGGASANVGVVLSTPHKHPSDLVLLRDPLHGLLSQRVGPSTYQTVASVHGTCLHEGELTGSVTGKGCGVVPVDGSVRAVILSVGRNMVSTTGGDGITAAMKVNGTVVTSTNPRITSSSGSGFRSTARWDGEVGVIKNDGTEEVRKGDVLTVDLTRTAAGTVSVEAADVGVLVVVRVNKPE
ncbi:MAG: hypothetical protein IT442_11945 [Phycisphaeraceae bacterium]|nr:hypothetical protein [Phycisphaeraceae bacterium]